MKKPPRHRHYDDLRCQDCRFYDRKKQYCKRYECESGDWKVCDHFSSEYALNLKLKKALKNEE